MRLFIIFRNGFGNLAITRVHPKKLKATEKDGFVLKEWESGGMRWRGF